MRLLVLTYTFVLLGCLAATSPAPKKVVKKEANFEATKLDDIKEQPMIEADEDATDVDRSKKSATTTFCVEIKPNNDPMCDNGQPHLHIDNNIRPQPMIPQSSLIPSPDNQQNSIYLPSNPIILVPEIYQEPAPVSPPVINYPMPQIITIPQTINPPPSASPPVINIPPQMITFPQVPQMSQMPQMPQMSQMPQMPQMPPTVITQPQITLPQSPPSVISQPSANPTIVSSSVVSPPVYQPSVVSPPVYQPSIVSPPVYQPSVVSPPVYQPPVVSPPIYQPPVVSPPVYQPPVVSPPVIQTPVYPPSIILPPVIQPPAPPQVECACHTVAAPQGQGSSIQTQPGTYSLQKAQNFESNFLQFEQPTMRQMKTMPTYSTMTSASASAAPTYAVHAPSQQRPTSYQLQSNAPLMTRCNRETSASTKEMDHVKNPTVTSDTQKQPTQRISRANHNQNTYLHPEYQHPYGFYGYNPIYQYPSYIYPAYQSQGAKYDSTQGARYVREPEAVETKLEAKKQSDSSILSVQKPTNQTPIQLISHMKAIAPKTIIEDTVSVNPQQSYMINKPQLDDSSLNRKPKNS